MKIAPPTDGLFGSQPARREAAQPGSAKGNFLELVTQLCILVSLRTTRSRRRWRETLPASSAPYPPEVPIVFSSPRRCFIKAERTLLECRQARRLLERFSVQRVGPSAFAIPSIHELARSGH